MRPFDRREFLALCGLGTGGSLLGSTAARRRPDYPPIRTITKGDKFHWFGYYDKLQFDPTDRFVLSNQVDFEHRTPEPGDAIAVGMIDTGEDDRWIELGHSRAWSWQQGCMLQWRPGSPTEVLWNDRADDRFVCRLLDVETKRQRTLPQPVYSVSPDGAFALSTNFARLQTMRPGYGYQGLPDPHHDQPAPRDSGIVRVDLDSGRSRLILSLSEIAAIEHQGQALSSVWHYFNHLLISPDGQRFVVLHRWRRRHPDTGRPTGGFQTRMITADTNGRDVYLLNPAGLVSHFIWRDPEHICMWTRPAGKAPGFYLYRDRSRDIEPVGEGAMRRDGHNSYLPGRPDWILCDSYPDRQRQQQLYLFDVSSGQRHEIGAFELPEPYRGEWRCDLHPRSSNDGLTVCIDSPHAGAGRQLHLIDISEFLG